MDSLQLVKAAVSVTMVLALSLIAERASPRVGGLLAGYPLGNALSLFFIGYEIGPGFAAEAAVHAQAGFTSAMGFSAGYLAALGQGGRWEVARAAGYGLAVFFAVSSLLQMLPGSLPLLMSITAVALVGFGFAYRRLPDSSLVRRPLTPAILLLRSAMAAALILAVTAAAHVLPARWAGLLSAFPLTMLPFLVIMHVSYGAETARTVIKHYPAGLGSLMLYALVVAIAYPAIGLGWGTLAGFAAATVYLIGFMQLQMRRRRSGSLR